ncbi:MAG: hypothetical protein AAF488_10805 [Planctomycetota bacterium]
MTARTPRTRRQAQPVNASPEQLSLLFEGGETAKDLEPTESPPVRGSHGSEGTRSVAPNPHPPAPTTTRHRWGAVVPTTPESAPEVPAELAVEPVAATEAMSSPVEHEARRESFPEKLARWKRESGDAVKAKARRLVPGAFAAGAFGRERRARVGGASVDSNSELDAQSQLYERARVFLARVPEADQRAQPSLELSLQSDESWTGLVVSLGLTAAAFAAAFLIA